MLNNKDTRSVAARHDLSECTIIALSRSLLHEHGWLPAERPRKA